MFPQSKTQKKISDLNVGDHCYTLPWALWVQTDGKCFLNEDYPASTKKEGTSQLKIERTENGYIAHIYDVDYKWSPSDTHGFLSADGVCYGEVIDFGKSSYELLSKEELQQELSKAVAASNFEKAAEIRDYIKSKFDK